MGDKRPLKFKLLVHGQFKMTEKLKENYSYDDNLTSKLLSFKIPAGRLKMLNILKFLALCKNIKIK